MKKTCVIRLTAVMLILSLFANFAIPVFAAEEPAAGPIWQDVVIESVEPIGDAPFLALDLMPNGYIITDYSIPMEYVVTFKDGSTTTARIQRYVVYDMFRDGDHIGHCFDVPAGDETITLYACIRFDEKTKQSVFEIGQVVFAFEEYEGETYIVDYDFFLISREPCRTEIDDSSWIARLLYPIYSAFQKFIALFAEPETR
ncbi:MAG: hypothetical protein IJL52_01100 [Clostridia bacterium]|nr:hypothetical protein [Clostridia bacterium]